MIPTNGNLKRHLMIHSGENPHKCNRCDRRIKTKSDVRKHFVTHTEDKPFQCAECKKTFRTKDNLKKHTLIHSPLKLYECGGCSERFKQPYQLRRHQDRMAKFPGHIYVRKQSPTTHQCNLCHKTFTHINNLRHHLVFSHRRKALRMRGVYEKIPSQRIL